MFNAIVAKPVVAMDSVTVPAAQPAAEPLRSRATTMVTTPNTSNTTTTCARLTERSHAITPPTSRPGPTPPLVTASHNVSRCM